MQMYGADARNVLRVPNLNTKRNWVLNTRMVNKQKISQITANF